MKHTTAETRSSLQSGCEILLLTQGQEAISPGELIMSKFESKEHFKQMAAGSFQDIFR